MSLDINPYQDAPADYCQRILALIDHLDDNQVQQLLLFKPDEMTLKMMELQVYIGRGNLMFSPSTAPPMPAYWPGSAPPVHIYSPPLPASGTADPKRQDRPYTSWRPWRKPRG